MPTEIIGAGVGALGQLLFGLSQPKVNAVGQLGRYNAVADRLLGSGGMVDTAEGAARGLLDAPIELPGREINADPVQIAGLPTRVGYDQSIIGPFAQGMSFPGLPGGGDGGGPNTPAIPDGPGFPGIPPRPTGPTDPGGDPGDNSPPDAGPDQIPGGGGPPRPLRAPSMQYATGEDGTAFRKSLSRTIAELMIEAQFGNSGVQRG